MELKTVKIKGKFTSIYLKTINIEEVCKIRRNIYPYFPLPSEFQQNRGKISPYVFFEKVFYIHK
jgi:hypothetical protein